MIEMNHDEVAPSFIKFYRYEEIKAKSSDLMTSKDKLRMKMHEKMKQLKQIPMGEGSRKDNNYVIDLEKIQRLKILEEEMLQTKTQRKNSRQIFHNQDPDKDAQNQNNDGDHDPGLQRLINIAAKHKLMRTLREEPVYMKPHKNKFINQKSEYTFKPQVMLGDLRKPYCEFTSDLVQLAHKTRLAHKTMGPKNGVKQSDSLAQKRLNARQEGMVKKMLREEKGELDSDSTD